METQHRERFNCELKKFFPRNFLAHIIEGGLYLGGLTFIASDILIPPFLDNMGAPKWITAFSPVLPMIGLSIPSIFISHHLEKLYWKKPLLMITGILQRIPVFLVGLMIFLMFHSHPLLVVAMVALCPLVSGFFCGITFPAWMDLIAKTIPDKKRASVFAFRNMITAAIGIVAGFSVKYFLDRYSEDIAYGLLYFIAFVMLMASYVVFAMIKETHLPPHEEEKLSFLENLKEVPEIIRNDRRFLYFLLNRVFMNGAFIAVPFLSIYTLHVLQKPQSFLGILLIATVVGFFTGNSVAAYLGDRFGGKIGSIISRLLYLTAFIMLIFVKHEFFFYLIFFLRGFCRDAAMVSGATLSMELCPEERRVKYMSIMSLTLLPGMFAAATIAAILWMKFTNSYTWIGAASSISMIMSIIFLLMVKEPREGKLRVSH